MLQVSSFAVQSLNKLLNLQAEEEFLRWCWDVMLSLKLHSNDVECDESNEEDSSVLLSIEESQQQGSCYLCLLFTENKEVPLLLSTKKRH